MLNSIRQNRWLIISLFLFVILGTVFFPSAGRDDDYIAFWSAASLLEFGELVNHNGERVEQGSSLGHIAILAVTSGLSRLPPPSVAVPVSIVSGIILLILLNRFKSFFDRRVVNCALLISATSFPFTYWLFSGLETSIYTLTLTLFSFVVLKITRNQAGTREYSYLFLVILALQLFRPEAFFVLGLLLGLFWLLKMAREITREEGSSALVTTVIQSEFTRFSAVAILFNFVVFAALATFRYTYFGSTFPQPVISKVSGIFPGLHSGIPIEAGGRYIIDFFVQNLVFLGAIITLLVVVSNIIGRRSKDAGGSADILIAIFLSQFAFILLSGPDWMEAFRFIVPVIPVLALTSAVFYHEFLTKNQRFRKPLIACLISIQAIGFGFFVTNDSSSIPLWATRNNIVQEIPGAQNYPWLARANTHHIRDIPVTEAMKETIRRLEPAVGDRPIIITSYQAGFVIYHVAMEYFGKIRFIDLAGLTDDTITKCPPLKLETQRLRDQAARRHQLGHIEVLRHLITESEKAGSCFSPRPDIIYLMSEVTEMAAYFTELGYELVFDNTGDLSLDFGKDHFYGGYLVDRKLIAKAGLEFERSNLSVNY